MTCSECGSSHLKKSQFDYDYSSECGIAEIVISSAERYECLNCSFVTVALGKLQEIDEKLVRLICSQACLLRGNQSRFLRLRLFDMDLNEFSKLTEIASISLAIIEGENLEHHPENSVKIRALAAKKITAKSFVIEFGGKLTKLGKS